MAISFSDRLYTYKMDKDKPKKRRQPPLKIDLSFDTAMEKIVKAKPPKKKKK